jgi:hypothetical protein
MNVSEAFEEDDPAEARRRASALIALRLKREAIIDLLQTIRPNGEPLADVAIAVRVGCKPSEVTRIRREHQEELNDASNRG